MRNKVIAAGRRVPTDFWTPNHVERELIRFGFFVLRTLTNKRTTRGELDRLQGEDVMSGIAIGQTTS